MKPHRGDGIDPAARSRARRRALQALYAWQLSNSPVDRVIEQFQAEQDMDIADLEYFEALVRGVAAHTEELDAVLSKFIDRTMAQVDPIERAVLRIAGFELRLPCRCPLQGRHQRGHRDHQALRRRARAHLRQRRARPRRRRVARAGNRRGQALRRAPAQP